MISHPAFNSSLNEQIRLAQLEANESWLSLHILGMSTPTTKHL
jgi:hypothetical protein